jgi:hypothetical protein
LILEPYSLRRTVRKLRSQRKALGALEGGYRGIYLPDERPVVEQVYGRIALVRYTNGYDERGVKLQSLLAVTMPKYHNPG